MKTDDFVKFKFPTNPVISPDGSVVVFPIKEINEEANSYKSALYKKDLSKEGYQKFTEGKSMDFNPKWSSDGKLIAFLSTRSGSSQLYVISSNGGESTQITNFSASIVDFEWSSDNKKFLVIVDVSEEDIDLIINPQKPPSFILQPEESEAYKTTKKMKKDLQTDPRIITEGYYREGTKYRDGKFPQPFIVDFIFPDNSVVENDLTKPKPKYIGEFHFHYTIGPFSLDDKFVYVSRRRDPAIERKTDFLEISIEPETKSKILFTQENMISDISLSPKGEFLTFNGQRITPDLKVYDNNQIYLYSLKDRPENPTVLTENFNWSASDPSWYTDDTLMFLSNHLGKTSIELLTIVDKSISTIIDTEQMINTYSANSQKSVIVYERSHYSEPVDIYNYNIQTKTDQRITDTNKYFKKDPTLGKLIPIPFSRDGIDFQGWLLLPTDYEQKSKVPVILEIHGGPAAMWSPHEKTMWFEFQILVSGGYAVFYCNPRGSDGYGIDFRKAVHQNWGVLAGNDILAGLEKALINYPKLDRDRVFVTGGSYGGYMTAWLVTHFNIFKGAVSQRGVYEFTAFAQTTDIPIWFEDGYNYELIDPERNTVFERDSPAYHIKNLQCPLLIIHSENDFRVPIVNAEQLFWLGKRYGKHVEFVRYPRDGHELSRSGEPRHIIDRLSRIKGLFEKFNT